MRCTVYFSSSRENLLCTLAGAWLGRDATIKARSHLRGGGRPDLVGVQLIDDVNTFGTVWRLGRRVI